MGRRINVGLANSVLLALLLPIVLRLWLEAVVWRIQQGPQMLGFALAHAGAGWITPLLFASFLATYAYMVWAIAVAILWLIPPLRARFVRTKLVLLGAASLVAFGAGANMLQREMATGLLYAGSLVLTALALIVFWIVIYGFKRPQGLSSSAI